MATSKRKLKGGVVGEVFAMEGGIEELLEGDEGEKRFTIPDPDPYSGAPSRDDAYHDMMQAYDRFEALSADLIEAKKGLQEAIIAWEDKMPLSMKVEVGMFGLGVSVEENANVEEEDVEDEDF